MMEGGIPRPQKKATSAPTIGVYRPPQPGKELNLMSMLDALEEISKPMTVPEATPMEAETSRGRLAKEAAGEKIKKALVKNKTILKAQQKQIYNERKRLLDQAMAKRENLPVENYQAIQKIDRDISYQTQQCEKYQKEIESLKAKLEAVQANLQIAGTAVMNYIALREYVTLKGLNQEIITVGDVYTKGMNLMNQGGRR